MNEILSTALKSGVLPMLVNLAAGAVYPRIVALMNEGENLLVAWNSKHPLAQEAMQIVAKALDGDVNIGGDFEAAVAPLIQGAVGSLSASDPTVAGTSVLNVVADVANVVSQHGSGILSTIESLFQSQAKTVSAASTAAATVATAPHKPAGVA